ncbi:MAG: 2-succinyl-5-enolpyruvyl-6-hydroxy-3-cyclohexene-1-carboxylic-acid synthase [Chloroflexales bacterium]|nr:2-succinyl-5-enolpyruvyl-6-hydroxy-3-cyclohexene-1-carboxylic-acid synthase [Chloroflexales bacterium]
MTGGNANQHALYLFVGALIDELARSGVYRFCVCPGSRSTPLALMIARHPTAQLWMHLDERSAAFFALGMAKASGEPVAIVCTSGTAAANLMPAVVEAFYARVPLIVLTADRPHELRDCGAPQTVDQVQLFGAHAKWFVDLPEPESTADLLRYVRTVACRAVATASQAPAGPVHLNCPYREPLVPVLGDGVVPAVERSSAQPYVAISSGARTLDPERINILAAELSGLRRGLIVCGPQDDPLPAEPLAQLAETLGYPILADPLSGLRCGSPDRAMVLDCYDAVLRNDGFAGDHVPEVVLRFGAMPTSKPLLLYLQRHERCRQIVVDGGAGWNEPTRLATEAVHAEPGQFCASLASSLRQQRTDKFEAEPWSELWHTADRLAREAIMVQFESLDELFEGKVFAELAQLLPDGATLWAGSSMPVRDLDTFFPCSDRSIRFLSNRGANGIDGVVSSALGASVANTGPLVLVIGDISFYHDSNGLLAAKQYGLDMTIVVLNNDGGGIFSFLPQASEPEHFETLFGTPHGLTFQPLAALYGAQYRQATSWEEFRAATRRGIAEGGLHIIEVVTERNRNVVLHRGLWQVVDQALERLEQKP